jgi:predicted SnoaL-like aldol condensation-catalyzing enzyme
MKGAKPMASEQNKAVLRRWMDAFSSDDRALLDRLAGELYTPDYTLHDPGVPLLPPGPAGVRQFVEGVFASWSNVRVSIDDLVAEGDRVATAYTVNGVSVATGKAVTVQGMSILRFVDGKIAEEWEVVSPEREVALVEQP